MTLLVRSSAFLLLTVLSAFSPLITLPLVARAGDADQWTAVGVGSTIGLFAATVGFAGWSVKGTAAVAALPPGSDGEVAIYARSSWTRASVVLVALPSAVVVTMVLTRSGGASLVGGACAAAFALSGLGMGWYAVGRGSPKDLLLFDAAPRLVASATAAGVVAITGELFAWPALLGLATLLGLAAFHRRTFGTVLPPRPRFATITAEIRAHASAWFVDVAGSAYSAVPIPIAAALLGGPAAAAYVSADRVYRYGLFVPVAAANALQSWVLPSGDRGRHSVALVIHVVIGATGGLVLATLGPLISELLLGDRVSAGRDLFLPLAVAYCCSSIAMPLIRNVLIPRGHSRAISVAVLVSGVTGITVMVAAASAMRSSVGIAQGLAVSEGVMLVALTTITVAVRRRRHGRPATGPVM